MTERGAPRSPLPSTTALCQCPARHLWVTISPLTRGRLGGDFCLPIQGKHPGSRIHRVARMLRRNQTAAERKLWQSLRGSQMDGFQFRRQFPIGDCSGDFCCRERRLVVELDGSQHAQAAGIAQDEERAVLIRARGYRVIRFWNEEVLKNLDGVLETILRELRQPPPDLPLVRGRDSDAVPCRVQSHRRQCG
jgi:very-short-patch-repair endonuclease